ncbi:hypothetical protein PCANC_17001 [Puccinia coronata f. sp. avenae]|uniref:Uncharacterized protein n=1 Tax=Puccinia coronata f. sp. avenae TaxID=200324 RepID=A0A2N5SLN1_9BASI|nr:hypothetical protein PCANC_17001 [Puccinia coronata f. sp. avenae]
MNTPGTMALGWGLLLVAGGGGLYYAKKDINERRREQARRGIRSIDTREWHERIADQQKSSLNQASDPKLTNSSDSEIPSEPGLSSTFSKFDRPYRQPDSNPQPSPNDKP